MMRFGPLRPEVTDLGDCDFDMITYEILGMCIVEKDLDFPTEYTERFKWGSWTPDDYKNAIEILKRLSENANRVRIKIEKRRDAILELEERSKHDNLPNPGDTLFVPSGDDIFGGKAVVKRLIFHPTCTNENNRVFVEFENLFEGGLSYNLKNLLEEQESLKKLYKDGEIAQVRNPHW